MKRSESLRVSRLPLLLLLTLGVTAIILCFSLYWVSTDAAVYLPAARFMAAGNLPYREFVHNYTPIVLSVHALLWKIWPGIPYGAFVYLQQAVVLAGALLCFRLALHTFHQSYQTSLCISIAYYLAVLAQEGNLIVLEPWVLLFVWLSFSLFFQKGRAKYLGAGIFIGLAFFCKQYGVLYLLPMLVYLGVKRDLPSIFQLLAGAALPVVLAILLLWIFKIPLDYTLTQLLAVDHQQLNTEGIFTMFTFLYGGKVLGWLLLISAAIIFVRHLYSEHRALFFFIISGVIILLLPTLFRHFSHYFMLSLPFLCIGWMVGLPASNTRKSFFFVLATLPVSIVFFAREYKNKDTYRWQKLNAEKVAIYAPMGANAYTPVNLSYLSVINQYTIPFAVQKGFAFVKLPFDKYEPLLPVGSFFYSEIPIEGVKVNLSNEQFIYLYKKVED